MKLFIGIALTCIGACIGAVLLWLLVRGRSKTKLFAFITDAWEFICLAVALLLLGVVLIIKYK